MERDDALALQTEAFLRGGSSHSQLQDLLSRLSWREDGETPDLDSLRSEVVIAVTDYVMLHGKEVDLDILCSEIEIKEKSGTITLQLPVEVIAWLQIR